MRRILAASLIFLAPVPALAADMALSMDQVRTITFAKPVSTVYVGNPSIADITMIDARHAFVIGKGFGSTNIVALNDDGKQVFDTRIAVLANGADASSTLVLNRGAQRVTYNCTSSHCEATPQPGDDKTAFDEIAGQLAAHSSAAKSAAAP